MQSRATVSRPKKSPTLRIESRMRFWSTRKINDWIVDHSDRSGHMTTMDQARTHDRSEFRSPMLDPLRGSASSSATPRLELPLDGSEHRTNCLVKGSISSGIQTTLVGNAPSPLNESRRVRTFLDSPETPSRCQFEIRPAHSKYVDGIRSSSL